MFQFKKVNGELHTLNEIDHLACVCWNTNYDNKHYAKPENTIHCPNWYDILGLAIEDCKNSCFTSSKGVCSWCSVRECILTHCIYCGRDVNLEGYKYSMEYAYHYIKLTHLLEDLGIKPIVL